MMRTLASLALVALLVSATYAAGPFGRGQRCGPGGCGTSAGSWNYAPGPGFNDQCGPQGCPVPQPSWKWVPSKRQNGEGRFELQRNGVMVGFYDVEGEYFQERIADGKWSAVKDPPIAITAAMKVERVEAVHHPFGVDRSKILDAEDCNCTVNGVPHSGIQAVMAQLSDDSDKLWLVITGNGREKVLADMKADPKLKDLLARCRVWSVPADHFSILDRDTKKPMFPTGDPGVYLGLPDGRQLFAAQGSIDLEALRKADPNNKPAPAPVPGPQPQPGPPIPTPLDPAQPKNPFLMPLCCVAGGLVLLSLLRRK